MTQQARDSRPHIPLHDRLNQLLDIPGPRSKKALLDDLRAEVASAETRAYVAGWQDALAELGRRTGRDA
ncbi:hypothetical protein ACL02U_06305 [Streptomyces sp. MS06]|uniref:hypothetical protein n=1 Tax=Streptomyces sp. MS06 TaxID=3385974 RepID=UPI00399FB2B9